MLQLYHAFCLCQFGAFQGIFIPACYRIVFFTPKSVLTLPVLECVILIVKIAIVAIKNCIEIPHFVPIVRLVIPTTNYKLWVIIVYIPHLH